MTKVKIYGLVLACVKALLILVTIKFYCSWRLISILINLF